MMEDAEARYERVMKSWMNTLIANGELAVLLVEAWEERDRLREQLAIAEAALIREPGHGG